MAGVLPDGRYPRHIGSLNLPQVCKFEYSRPLRKPLPNCRAAGEACRIGL